MYDEMFIDPAWISLNQDGASHVYLDRDLIKRAYSMWRHAEAKITPVAHDLDRADAILWLNRTVNLRIKSLYRDHDLRAIARSLGMNKASPSEIMAGIGLIRPRMLRELTVLRNAVEHQDAAPPSFDRCQEFSEVVWYFLRSTDDIARVKLDDLDLGTYPGLGNGNITVDFDTRDAKLAVSGRLPIKEVSWNKRDGWTSIELTGKPRIRARMVQFTGIVTGPRDSLSRIWRRYFQLDDSYL